VHSIQEELASRTKNFILLAAKANEKLVKTELHLAFKRASSEQQVEIKRLLNLGE
jgi:hypothetical protein